MTCKNSTSVTKHVFMDAFSAIYRSTKTKLIRQRGFSLQNWEKDLIERFQVQRKRLRDRLRVIHLVYGEIERKPKKIMERYIVSADPRVWGEQFGEMLWGLVYIERSVCWFFPWEGAKRTLIENRKIGMHCAAIPYARVLKTEKTNHLFSMSNGWVGSWEINGWVGSWEIRVQLRLA